MFFINYFFLKKSDIHKNDTLFKYNEMKSVFINSDYINFNVFFPRSYTRHNKKILMPDFNSAKLKH